ncbi:hypothetical protein OED52_01035 [Rhodococcus sp. Z13]|uniref:Uncharacterized protein n=1 Tax=Rhodococcus sacchari TaxID=2962047 RepID=A0ACD4DGS6_9NOCA|nr:hypothetical protein [Rhodococcus sp. Z13]UYP19207.1 hypothetical protein OED52_01035 [Rhodococcus sp. Z13]
MNEVGMAIRELHRSENAIAVELLRIADRHKTDHEVFHVARDIARWSQRHVRELARVGRDYGVDLDDEPKEPHELPAALRRRASELLGRRHAPSLLLLRDLRTAHRMAAGVSLDWEVLAQTAQALGDRELLAASQRCHPQTLRQLRWANAKLKEIAAQAVVTA